MICLRNRIVRLWRSPRAWGVGLPRDRTFLIEKGKITRSLKNVHWNESPLLMLNRLEDVGWPEPVAAV